MKLGTLISMLADLDENTEVTLQDSIQSVQGQNIVGLQFDYDSDGKVTYVKLI